MARLYTGGHETQGVGTAGATGQEGLGSYVFGTPTITTATVCSGAAAMSCPGVNSGFSAPTTMVLDRAYFGRVYVNFADPTPAANSGIVLWYANGINVGWVGVTPSSTLYLSDSTNAVVGSESPAISAGVWYRIELKIIIPTAGSGTLEFRLATGDGPATTIASSAAMDVNNSVTAPEFYAQGHASGGATVVDNWAVNDDQGTNQNSWPGPGKVVMLKPISDNARVGFVGGAGGTTSMFDAENNTPPIGVITTSATDASQNESPTNNATDTYDANLGAYKTAVASGGGGLNSDTVTLVQLLTRGGNSTTTSRTLAASGLSNPAITETTQASGTTATGTEPTGWTTFRSAVTYNPDVVLGTSPVVRVRKGTASTNVMQYDLQGLYVEYVPRRGPARSKPRTAVSMPGSGAVYR